MEVGGKKGKKSKPLPLLSFVQRNRQSHSLIQRGFDTRLCVGQHQKADPVRTVLTAHSNPPPRIRLFGPTLSSFFSPILYTPDLSKHQSVGAQVTGTVCVEQEKGITIQNCNENEFKNTKSTTPLTRPTPALLRSRMCNARTLRLSSS